MNLPPPPEQFQPKKTSKTFVILLVCLGAMGCCGLGLLPAMLLPAVQKVRTAAMRAKSQNNLRQMAIAIHNCNDANNNRFPYICDFGPESPTSFGVFSLHYHLLPYLEKSNGTPVSPTGYYGKGSGIASEAIRCFLNPMEMPNEQITVPAFGIGVEAPGATDPYQARFEGWYSTTNYVANGMVFSPQLNGKPPGLKTITDGTTQTIMLAERCQVSGTPANEVPTLWGLGAYSAATASFALALPDGQYPKTPGNKLALKQYVPTKDDIASGKLPPCFQVMPKPGTLDPSMMQTLNPTGMIVCMFDGSTAIIRANVKSAVFWAAVTPAGDEGLGSDW